MGRKLETLLGTIMVQGEFVVRLGTESCLGLPMRPMSFSENYLTFLSHRVLVCSFNDACV